MMSAEMKIVSEAEEVTVNERFSFFLRKKHVKKVNRVNVC